MKEEIIGLLKQNTEPLSGEQICRYFHISRSGIWKHIQELRKEGYVIDAETHKGYSLRSSPDKLLPCELKYGLKTKKIGKEIYYYDSLDTTMEVAFKLGTDGEKEGSVVISDEQAKGKGRLGRKWSSPKGKGIYMSILLRPRFSIADASKLTLMSAVAICEVIREQAGIEANIKWPNDILVGKNKLAGILTEMNAETDRINFIVVGIGINVNTPKNLIPDHATSLKNETGKTFSRVKLSQAILQGVEKWYSVINTDGFDKVLFRWKEMSSTLGSNVKVVERGEEIIGKAIDIDEFGRLVIKDSSGQIFKKISGDVFQE